MPDDWYNKLPNDRIEDRFPDPFKGIMQTRTTNEVLYDQLCAVQKELREIKGLLTQRSSVILTGLHIIDEFKRLK